MAISLNWEQISSELSKQIPPQQHRAWIEPVRFLGYNNNQVDLLAPSPLSCEWISEHYKPLMEDIIRNLYGIDAVISIKISDGVSDITSSTPLESQDSFTNDIADLIQVATQEPVPEAISESEKNPTPLKVQGRFIAKTIGDAIDPKHTFETFVVGASNQFAHAACRAVAEQPASQYNPLFLYSDAGLGKTHLLHAIGNSLLQNNPKARICYLSAEAFANELIECIRHERMPQFRQKFRDSFDMLLMDDFQFIAGKDRTQEEFFHTFNALHSSKRQIVVTSDKSPKDIPGLEDRVRTRFEWGLIADIQPPEVETRIAILRMKAERDDIYLSDDVALFLASNIKTNIRELEGALVRLEAQASLGGVEISLDLAKQELANLVKNPITAISSDAIQNAVSRHFNIRVADLKSRDRSRKYALPRQITMFLLRKYTGKSLPEIGLTIGGKDHSTVLYGINSIKKAIDSDPLIQKHVTDIQNML